MYRVNEQMWKIKFNLCIFSAINFSVHLWNIEYIVFFLISVWNVQEK